MKILIIGQAPAAVKQEYPYSTTMLYDWLAECGVTIDQAQDIFDFEAIYNKFPGYDENMQHKKPTPAQMAEHWPLLEEKLQMADKVILLGNVAKEYYDSRPRTWSCNLMELYLMHPSRRNIDRYRQNKTALISSLKAFLES